MSSRTPSTPSPIEAPSAHVASIEDLSADLVGPFRRRLTALCAAPRQHARFLNMLSLMEHIGSRKIMRSQSGGELGIEVLKHLSEEARHAYFFKRLAERVGGRADDYSERHTLVPTAAAMYVGRLDAGINRSLGPNKPGEVPYLYVSMIIEHRAIWAYHHYHAVLIEQGTGLSLKSVIAEEELHLPQMVERLTALGEDITVQLPTFLRLEDGLFRTLWRAVETACREDDAIADRAVA